MLTLSLLGIGAIAVASVVTAGLMAYTINGALTWFSENASLHTPIDNAMRTAEIITEVSTNLAESVVEAVETVANIAIEKAEAVRTGIAVLSDIALDLEGGGLTEEELARLIGLGRTTTGTALTTNATYLLASEITQRVRNRVNRNSKENMDWHHCYEIFINGPLVNSRIPSVFRAFTMLPNVRLFMGGPGRTRILIIPDRTKVGISDNFYLNKNGTSSRANRQVNSFNRSLSGVTGHIAPELEKPYTSVIVINTLPGRTAALAWELARSMQKLISGHSMHRHLDPRN